MKMNMIILILLVMAKTIRPKLEVEFGVVKNTEDTKCSIRSNGIEAGINGTGYFNGLWFGLIEYKCEDTIGTLVSKMTCKPCGIYCKYNSMIEGCDNWLVPFIISAATLSAILIIVLILASGQILKFSQWMLVVIIQLYYRLIDMRTIKRINYLKKHTELSIEPRIHQTFPILPKEVRREIEKWRISRINNATGCQTFLVNKDGAEYIEIGGPNLESLNKKEQEITSVRIETPVQEPQVIKNETSLKLYPNIQNVVVEPVKESAPIYSESKHKRLIKQSLAPPPVPQRRINSPKTHSKPSLAVTAATIALLASQSLPQTKGCDETLYLHGQGQVCKNEVCTELKTTLFTTKTGGIICLQDPDSNIFQIKILESRMKNRYNIMYYTSDYELETSTYSNCKGAGECWNGGCYEGKKGNRFGAGTYEIEGFTCDDDAVGCDTWCYHQISCVYTHWWIKPAGPKYPVYKKESEIWEVTIETSYKNITNRQILNLNNPSANLNNIGLVGVRNVPLVIVNFDSEKIARPNGAVTIDGHTVFTSVSDVNMPETDKIGDYQLALIGNTTTYNTHNVRCQVNSCKSKCIIPEPKIQRVIRNLDNIVKGQSQSETYKRGGVDVVETSQLVNSHITLMIGNIEVESLKVTPGSCELEPAMTFACLSCTQKPYIVFNTYNIKQEGTIMFNSNCTFDTYYLSCNIEPYKLSLLSNDKICTIYIPSLNKTIHVNFEYNFLGTLDVSKSVYAIETTEEVLKSVVTSKGFIDGLTWTFTGFFAMTTITVTIVRCVKAITLYKISKDNKPK